jgi:hypothetical protein
MQTLLSLVMLVVLGTPVWGDEPKKEKIWNWDGNGVDDKFVDRTVKKEPYFEGDTGETFVNNRMGFKKENLKSQKAVKIEPKKAPVVIHNPVPVPVNLRYNRFPMIAPNGTFNSIRYLDLNREAGALYNISGAAIHAYGLRSMYERNQLERMLDNEQAWRRISRNQLLLGRNVPGFVNLIPWQPTKKVVHD